MCDDLAMHDAPCPELHQEEHIESLQPGVTTTRKSQVTMDRA